jgi:hypothetical protein
MKSTVLWDITPCSPLKVNRRFAETYRLHLQGSKNKPSKKPAWKHLLNMEAICSSKTSVDFQRTTRRRIPENSTLHCFCCPTFYFHCLCMCLRYFRLLFFTAGCSIMAIPSRQSAAQGIIFSCTEWRKRLFAYCIPVEPTESLNNQLTLEQYVPWYEYHKMWVIQRSFQYRDCLPQQDGEVELENNNLLCIAYNILICDNILIQVTIHFKCYFEHTASLNNQQTVEQYVAWYEYHKSWVVDYVTTLSVSILYNTTTRENTTFKRIYFFALYIITL